MTAENPEVPRARFDPFTGDGRRYRLVREEDETGVSGTGIVGVGVEFPDGQAVFMWTNDSNPDGPDTNMNSVYVYPGGIADVREVHGHSGKTRVEWVDPSRAVREGDAVVCSACGVEVPVSEWTVYRKGGGSCPFCGHDHLPDRVRLSRER
jgi:predicted RNA-binding Zn-ribbon protein involved in translation (DUF1610 family)